MNEKAVGRVETAKPFLFAGLREHFTTASWSGIPGLWQRFGADRARIPDQVSQHAYGLCFIKAGGVDYMTAAEVPSFDELPPEFSRASVPEQRYLIFPHREHVSKLKDTLDAIWHRWLPESGYKVANVSDGAPNFFERYGERFNPALGTGDIEVWIPIEENEN